MPLLALHAPSGPVLVFFVLFAVILIGPVVFARLGLPGLIGLVLGGFIVGAHGLDLIDAGNHTVPELGHLGLLYLMFIAGLELDLQVLAAYRRAAVAFGLLAFVIPLAAGLTVGFALGWSTPAAFLLGALLSSHTLIVYPTLREAGLAGNPAVASAIGATVLTDTLALVTLAIVAGTQTDSGSLPLLIGEIILGLAVLLAAALLVLPRLVDLAFRFWGSDRVARYVVVIVALLFMAMLAQIFDIEGIVGAFFAGLALNRLVPNESPSMERVEFFGAAVFVPVFLVSIGLLLDPSVMFTTHTLGLAALLIVAAMGGKAIACWLAGPLLGFSRIETLAMYVLTIPQAAATLAATLIGFDIGLFSTSVVNAVLVLILVTIVASALLAQQVIARPLATGHDAPALGSRILVVTTSTGPSDAAMRLATLLARPDGGHSDLVIARAAAMEHGVRGELDRRIFRHGFDGHVRRDIDEVADALSRALRTEPVSLVIVDEAGFEAQAGEVPLLVVDGETPDSARLIAGDDPDGSLADEIQRRIAKTQPKATPPRSTADAQPR
jgi:Kef-type K+ transport system membrane component KefB